VKDCHPLWIGSPYGTQRNNPLLRHQCDWIQRRRMPGSAVLVRMSMNSLALGLTGTDTPASVEATFGQVEDMRPGNIVPLAKTSLVEGRCSGIGKIAVGLIHAWKASALRLARWLCCRRSRCQECRWSCQAAPTWPRQWRHRWSADLLSRATAQVPHRSRRQGSPPRPWWVGE